MTMLSARTVTSRSTADALRFPFNIGTFADIPQSLNLCLLLHQRMLFFLKLIDLFQSIAHFCLVLIQSWSS